MQCVLKIKDGPAAGKTFFCRRDPEWLRVTVCPTTLVFDCLDMPEDQAMSHERIFLYRRSGERTTIHLDRRVGGKRVGEWFRQSEYVFLKDLQPSDEAMRKNGVWQTLMQGLEI